MPLALKASANMMRMSRKHTGNVPRPAHLAHQPPTWLQQPPRAFQRPPRVARAPVQRCAGENLVTCSYKTCREPLSLEEARVLYVRDHQIRARQARAVHSLCDLSRCPWPHQRAIYLNEHTCPTELLTILSLTSTPTTSPSAALPTFLTTSNVTSPLPHPKSAIRSPLCAASSSSTGAVCAGANTNAAAERYAFADHPDASRSFGPPASAVGPGEELCLMLALALIVDVIEIVDKAKVACANAVRITQPV